MTDSPAPMPRPAAPLPAPPHGLDPGQRLARVGLAFVLLLLGYWTLEGFLPALAWAGIIAVALWPLYGRARRRLPPKGHDILLPALFTLVVTAVFLLPLGLLAVQAAREAQSMARWLLEAQSAGLPPPAWLDRLPYGREDALRWWADTLSNPGGTAELLGRLDRSELLAAGRRFGAAVLHRAVLFGFTLLALFFLFRDGEALASQALRGTRRAFGAGGERLLRQMVASVHGTVAGLVLVGLGEGVALGVAYALAGVPHPTLLGAATALAAVVPFGAPVVFGGAALALLAQGAAVAAAAVFGFGMAVLFVADHFIRPALIGGATRLPFLLVLLGILGGVEAFGLLGLFAGPAIMAALTMLWREWTEAPGGG